MLHKYIFIAYISMRFRFLIICTLSWVENSLDRLHISNSIDSLNSSSPLQSQNPRSRIISSIYIIFRVSKKPKLLNLRSLLLIAFRLHLYFIYIKISHCSLFVTEYIWKKTIPNNCIYLFQLRRCYLYQLEVRWSAHCSNA